MKDPDEGRTIRSIVFTHDGTRYTATVGEAMRRQAHSRDRKKARMGVMEPETTTGDYVLKIQPGVPTWLVYLDAVRNTRYWVNPFMVGRPSIDHIVYDE